MATDEVAVGSGARGNLFRFARQSARMIAGRPEQRPSRQLQSAVTKQRRWPVNRFLTRTLPIVVVTRALSAAHAAGAGFLGIYSQAYDSSLNPIGTPATVPLGSYVQFDFRMQFGSDLPGEDFWRVNVRVFPQP